MCKQVGYLGCLLAAAIVHACQKQLPTEVPLPAADPTVADRYPAPDAIGYPHVDWSSDPTDGDHGYSPELARAWARFVHTQPYRLALPQDRKFAREALSRMGADYPGLAQPSLIWWGIQGFRQAGVSNVLIAIVVDPTRSDTSRFGLVVLAAPGDGGGRYNAYWVVRDADLSAWALSPASGSVFIRKYHPDGSDEEDELYWDRRGRTFRISSLGRTELSHAPEPRS